jgi:hypothetical protein
MVATTNPSQQNWLDMSFVVYILQAMQVTAGSPRVMGKVGGWPVKTCRSKQRTNTSSAQETEHTDGASDPAPQTVDMCNLAH